MYATVPPFLKWAGGKRWLVATHPEILPAKPRRLIEPFLGGAAVFFHLSPSQAVLSDTNAALIACYEAIHDDWRAVQTHLHYFAKKHSDEYYYVARGTRYRNRFQEAARFIYLNRTCFNGIYRENLRGEFNVPRGSKNSIMFDTDDFSLVSRHLNIAEIRCCDFEETINQAGSDDFIFADPPYTVRHNNNGFIKYNQKIFCWNDQIRLFNSVKAAAFRGAKCLVMNADHSSIRKLYEGLGVVRRLSRSSVVGASAQSRGRYSEAAIIIGYDWRTEGARPPAPRPRGKPEGEAIAGARGRISAIC